MRLPPVEPALPRALEAWLRAAALRPDPVGAATAAAEALAGDPWRVVTLGGALARTSLREAPRDLGIAADLSWCDAVDPRAIARVPRGAPCPALDMTGRRTKGAFDTPAALAREAVDLALRATRRPARRGLDPSCGSGAFLVALDERGLEAEGVELDPATAAVARIAAPKARIWEADGLSWRPEQPLDLVVGNPPFVPPERQTPALRAALGQQMPWLEGRFDLSVPFAARAAEHLAPGGGLCLVLPAPLLCQPYARPLRERWTLTHQITALGAPIRFPGATVEVCLVALRAGAGPAPLPDHGLDPRSWSSLPGLPWDPELAPGDPELLAHVLERSLPLGDLCEIDTGVVAHGPLGGKERLLSDQPAPGLLPYVDARDLSLGRRRWLRYEPETMHRPKRLALFAGPKLLVQRIRGAGEVHAWLDTEGLIAGHTLNVARPRRERIPASRLLDLLLAPESAGLCRLRNGRRLDLYPKDLAAWPVPRRWLDAPQLPLAEAWGLTDDQIARLRALASGERGTDRSAPVAGSAARR